jgi:hypothetical protein
MIIIQFCTTLRTNSYNASVDYLWVYKIRHIRTRYPLAHILCHAMICRPIATYSDAPCCQKAFGYLTVCFHSRTGFPKILRIVFAFILDEIGSSSFSCLPHFSICNLDVEYCTLYQITIFCSLMKVFCILKLYHSSGR